MVGCSGGLVDEPLEAAGNASSAGEAATETPVAGRGGSASHGGQPSATGGGGSESFAGSPIVIAGSGSVAGTAGTSAAGAPSVSDAGAGGAPITTGGANNAGGQQTEGGSSSEAGAGGETAEPVCQCDAGPCCDGCHFRPASHFCGKTERYSSCTGDAVATCEGATRRIEIDYWNLFCSGASTECDRWGPHVAFSGSACDPGLVCVESGDRAECVACP